MSLTFSDDDLAMINELKFCGLWPHHDHDRMSDDLTGDPDGVFELVAPH
jgi:hypothetical protein